MTSGDRLWSVFWFCVALLGVGVAWAICQRAAPTDAEIKAGVVKDTHRFLPSDGCQSCHTQKLSR